MASLFPSGNYRSFPVNISDTSDTTIYTCPTYAVCAFIVWIAYADDGGAARTVTTTLVDATGPTTYTIGYQEAIAANTPLTKELYLVLGPQDTIKVTASAGGVHTIVTAIEVARQSGQTGIGH